MKFHPSTTSYQGKHVMKTLLISAFRTLALMLVLLLAQPSHGAVNVHGAGSSTGENVMVDIYADITTTPVISYTFRLHYNANALRVTEAIRNDAVWYLGDAQNPHPYDQPDSSVAGEVLFVGGKLDSNDPLAGVIGSDILLGRVVFERRTAVTPAFNLSIGHEGDYASFVTRDGAVLDALPGEVTFGTVWPSSQDKDLDGLTDKWEVEFFDDIRRAFYWDDPDEDGYNHLAEEGFGTDPTDPRSHLDLTISPNGEFLLSLEWFSTEERTYAVEVSKDLESFRPWLTGVMATPPRNSVAIQLGKEPEKNFYRIRLENWPAP